MSIISAAISEMQLANFDEGDIAFMTRFLKEFFDRYDSGGAVWVMSQVVSRLIKGQPLAPLTGKDDEWMEVGPSVYQNLRCGTVFKNEEGRCYDLDTPGLPTITFPYDPVTRPVAPPEIIVQMEGE